MTHHILKRSVPAIVVAVALGLAGCSSTTGTGGASAGASADPEVGTALTDADVTTALSYVGGTAGKADSSKTPVKVGVINVFGGVPSFPEVAPAISAAEKLVNEKLGGVDGHPLQVVSCNIVNGDADGLKCAQQFANDPDIDTIQLAMTPLGTGPIYSTIGTKKNVLGFGAFGPQDLTATGVNFYGAATYSMAPGVLLYAKNYLKAKTVALVYDGTDPGVISNAQVEKALAPSLGMTVTAVPASDASQWSSALVSAGAKTADVIATIGNQGVCAPTAQAYQQLGLTAPVISFNFCQASSVKKSLGDYPKWTFLSPVAPFIGTTDKTALAYRDAMHTYSPDADLGGSAAGDFGLLLTQVKSMNAVGYDKLSVESIRKWQTDFTGPVFMGATSLSCGKYADVGAPALCDTYASVIRYDGDGKWTDPTDGKGIDTNGLGLGSSSK